MKPVQGIKLKAKLNMHDTGVFIWWNQKGLLNFEFLKPCKPLMANATDNNSSNRSDRLTKSARKSRLDTRLIAQSYPFDNCLLRLMQNVFTAKSFISEQGIKIGVLSTWAPSQLCAFGIESTNCQQGGKMI